MLILIATSTLLLQTQRKETKAVNDTNDVIIFLEAYVYQRQLWLSILTALWKLMQTKVVQIVLYTIFLNGRKKCKYISYSWNVSSESRYWFFIMYKVSQPRRPRLSMRKWKWQSKNLIWNLEGHSSSFKLLYDLSKRPSRWCISLHYHSNNVELCIVVFNWNYIPVGGEIV